MAFLGLASIGTSFANNTMQLLIWRFLTGLALAQV